MKVRVHIRRCVELEVDDKFSVPGGAYWAGHPELRELETMLREAAQTGIDKPEETIYYIETLDGKVMTEW